jgi:hypothetical protein
LKIIRQAQPIENKIAATNLVKNLIKLALIADIITIWPQINSLKI